MKLAKAFDSSLKKIPHMEFSVIFNTELNKKALEQSFA